MKERMKIILFKIFNVLLFIFRIFKLHDNYILCLNFHGKGYGDNPKYIAEKIYEKDKHYKIIWVIENPKFKLPDYIKSVKKYSIAYFYYLHNSKFIISNCRLPLFFKKRKKQFYIQTWHSPLRLKKIELDASEELSTYYMEIMKNDSQNIDLMISGCEFSHKIYQNSFIYNGQILKIGTPRCDIFFDKIKVNKLKEKIINKYNIQKNKKILLYAPTFRTNCKMEDVLMNCSYIAEKLKEYQILVRFHPKTKMQISDKNIIDVTLYPDMQELICVSDMLITDYSSCSFDMLIANKPCILFVKDLDEYLAKERGLYFKIDELPFYKVKSEEEVIEIVKNNNYNEYYSKVENFKNKINLYEKGFSCQKIFEIIKEKEKESEKI